MVEILWDGRNTTKMVGGPLYTLLSVPLLLAFRLYLCRKQVLPESLCGNDLFVHPREFVQFPDPVAYGFFIGTQPMPSRKGVP
jgi:hypothetical protein